MFRIARKFLSITKEVIKMKGAKFVLSSWNQMLIGCLLQYLGWPCLYARRRSRRKRTFVFLGRTYSYFYHLHNTTWRNERAVEIPIIWELVKGYREERVLEVGNVLAHYSPVRHDVLDKYEKGRNVINQDLLDFRPTRTYDLIVSISTLEHVGWYWYDNPADYSEERILSGIRNLISHLAPGGRLAVTLPVDYNSRLDSLIRTGRMQFTELYFLKRVSRHNEWIEAGWKDARDAKYGKPFPGANLLIIGIMEKGDFPAEYQ